MAATLMQSLLNFENALKVCKDRGSIWVKRRALLINRINDFENDNTKFLFVDSTEAVNSITARDCKSRAEIIALELKLVAYPPNKPVKFYSCWAHVGFCFSLAVSLAARHFLPPDGKLASAQVDFADFDFCARYLGRSVDSEGLANLSAYCDNFQAFLIHQLKLDDRNFHAWACLRTVHTWRVMAQGLLPEARMPALLAVVRSFVLSLDGENESANSYYINCCLLREQNAEIVNWTLTQLWRRSSIPPISLRAALIRIIFPWYSKHHISAYRTITDYVSTGWEVKSHPLMIQLSSDLNHSSEHIISTNRRFPFTNSRNSCGFVWHISISGVSSCRVQYSLPDNRALMTLELPATGLSFCTGAPPCLDGTNEHRYLSREGDQLLERVVWDSIERTLKPDKVTLQFWLECIRLYILSSTMEEIVLRIPLFEKVVAALPLMSESNNAMEML
eukprot:Gregarina_sp_Poly_1__10287@NODE_723_length_6600_cov_64_797949_g543_i0_p2_GENE_NODE_723_length_6600_cov_64_797949_g543_i0NODE_723_length_6600_cov_64_797949_g543_i0_p2_ORF_typecomplete_len448_score32_03_NODE_723_length_6600_cov_64_797949_g543_i013972740